jgi:hypothetical protein
LNWILLDDKRLWISWRWVVFVMVPVKMWWCCLYLPNIGFDGAPLGSPALCCRVVNGSTWVASQTRAESTKVEARSQLRPTQEHHTVRFRSFPESVILNERYESRERV